MDVPHEFLFKLLCKPFKDETTLIQRPFILELVICNKKNETIKKTVETVWPSALVQLIKKYPVKHLTTEFLRFGDFGRCIPTLGDLLGL